MKSSVALFGSAALAAMVVSAGAAHGALALSLSGPSTQTYANGGGSGFGGTLGAGSVSFGASGGNLNVTFTPGAALNDIAVFILDTRNGGVGDFEMNDTADGGRAASSSPALNGFVNGPTDMNTYTPGSGGGVGDFALAIGNFGSVLFELVPGTNLNFVAFNAAPNISIPLSALGSPSTIDFYAYYTAGSQYLSNESLPASAALNSAGNHGFDAGTYSVDNFNRFEVPAPGAAALLGLGTLVAARRRRN
jgi:MYXO-CTERM domain-containing protein